MVDALRSAKRVLRTGGVVVDLQPAAEYRPRLALAAERGRMELGLISRTPDEDVVAAHEARREAVRAGLFTLAASTRAAYRSRYRGPADLRWLLRQNANWSIAPPLQRRVAAAWRKRPKGATIEIRRALSLAVLRRRSSSR